MTDDALKRAVREYADRQGVDLVGFVSTDHLNQVIPTRYGSPGCFHCLAACPVGRK